MTVQTASATLAKLRRDHSLFTRLLRAVTRQAETVASGGEANRDLLTAIVGYFETYPTTGHHPCEELIYGHLICQRPTDARGVFTLLGDHQELSHRTGVFRTAIADLGQSEKSRVAFVSEARTFVASQEEHIRAEESTFFPDAERFLTPSQWAEVDRGPCGHDVTPPGALPAALAPFAALLPAGGPDG